MRMVIVASTLALLAGHAAAQSTAADAEVKLAEDAAAMGDFVGAANHYKLAHAADSTRPDHICNAGVAYYKAKDATRAHFYLSRCQERGGALDAEFVQAVRTALAAVEATLRAGEFTPVDIVANPPGATVVVGTLGESDAFVGSRQIWLPRGKHALTVRMEGYAPKVVELDAQGSEPKPVAVTLDKATTTTTVTGTVTPIERMPIGEAPVHHPSKVPGIVAIGGTVLAFVVAGIAYSKAHDAADMAREAVNRPTYDDDKASAKTWNGVMIGTGILGLGGAAASTVLVLRW